tara:strand:- start:50 stop:322 length:273 start_codon:yes stop_codon:yes gene_type:complete
MIKNKKERKTMSNNYDIEIKMDYFYESDSYEDMLEKKKEFEEEVKDHLNYFKKISKSEKVFLKERDYFYGDDYEYLNDPLNKKMGGESYE